MIAPLFVRPHELLWLYIIYCVGALLLLRSISKFVEYCDYKSKLDRIPTIGYSGMLTSYLSAIKALWNGREIIQEGYEKYYDGIFKVPLLDRWMIVASGPKRIEELRKVSDDQVSLTELIREDFQLDYTLGPSIQSDPYHLAIMQNVLTRNVAAQFADIRDESLAAFASEIPVTDDWIKIPVAKASLNIVCRVSNRVFVGVPLCRDPDYLDLNTRHTINVALTASFINLWPGFMKPVIGRIMSPISNSYKRAVKHLRPVIEERLTKAQDYGRDYPDKPNDFLSWLIDESTTSERRTVRDLTIRMIGLNFSAIHTTNMVFTNALYHLAAYPDYINDLRKEAESVIEEHGWTKVAMGKLRKLDSFLKECERIKGNGSVTMSRKVLKDFTFSDGTIIPAGAIIAVVSYAMHQDKKLYSDADVFKGFRFVREEEGEGLKHLMVTQSSDYVIFGHGRHACPGRFFAVNELKALLAHVLLTYDLKFEKNSGVPPPELFGILSHPNRTAEVMFRKRRV